MESRKVQEVSGGTLTVSLPQEWAESESIEQGTVVDIRTHLDGRLVVQSPEVSDLQKHVTVDVDADDTDAIEYVVWAAYAAGVDEVTIVGHETLTGAQRRTAERVARLLAGVTTTVDGTDEMTVKLLLDSGEVSVRQLVRQLGFTALSMQRKAMAVLTEERSATDLGDRDDHADRQYAMIDRSFERSLAYLHEVDALGLTRTELFELWVTARELERVADHAERIAAVAVEATVPLPSDDLQRLSELAREVVEGGVDSIVGDGGASAAREALRARNRVRQEAADLERRLFDGSAGSYRHVRVLDSLRRTAEHGGNVAERGIQATIRRGDQPVRHGPDTGVDDRESDWDRESVSLSESSDV